MRGINVDALSERECGRVVIDRRVGRRVVNRNWGVGEPGNKLLDVPHSQSTSGRIAESRIIPEIQIDAKNLG